MTMSVEQYLDMTWTKTELQVEAYYRVFNTLLADKMPKVRTRTLCVFAGLTMSPDILEFCRSQYQAGPLSEAMANVPLYALLGLRDYNTNMGRVRTRRRSVPISHRSRSVANPGSSTLQSRPWRIGRAVSW